MYYRAEHLKSILASYKSCVFSLEHLCSSALEYIHQLESAQPKWISVEERLPEEEGMYIVYITRIKGDAFIGTDHYDLFNHWCGEGWYDGRCVTHWMPFSILPEPPKEV